MTEDEKQLLGALAWMTEQYITDAKGEIDHLFMHAGECAVEVLAKHGLVEVSHGGGKWTPAGRAFLDTV